MKLKELQQENKQLKQSQNSRAIEVLEQLLDKYEFYQNSDNSTLVEPIPNDTMIPFYTYVLNKITELRGGDVEKA